MANAKANCPATAITNQTFAPTFRAFSAKESSSKREVITAVLITFLLICEGNRPNAGFSLGLPQIGWRYRRMPAAMMRNIAANTRPNHNPGEARNAPGVRCIPGSMGIAPLCSALLTAETPPPMRFSRNPAKYEVWNATFSKTPMANGGKTAQRNGARRAHAEISSNHAYIGAYHSMCAVTR